jgi:hypothetical protein
MAIIEGASDALTYFMPDLAYCLDESREIKKFSGVELLEKNSNTDKNMLVSDVFLSVPVKGRNVRNIACLVEQQHANVKNFGARIFDLYLRLLARHSLDTTTVFALHTGDSKKVNSYTGHGLGVELTLKFREFHLLSYDVEELRRDKRAFARVMYAGRMSHEIGDDLALREKYAYELLKITDGMSYDKEQKRFIIMFCKRIFRLNDPDISKELKEAYRMITESLLDASNRFFRDEGRDEGREEAMLEVARTMLADGCSVETIRKYTGLDEDVILSLM